MSKSAIYVKISVRQNTNARIIQFK